VIPTHLKEIINYVFDYAHDSSDDWFTIKKEIVNNFPPKERKRFSRRHYSTKKHILNGFDYEVINYWEEKSGKKLFIDEEKLHPTNWEQKPKGWGLQRINEERRRNKEATKTN
jgi:hypothetical protein